MDVLLVNAPTAFGSMAKGTAPPLGLAYLSSFLKKNRFAAAAIDMAYGTGSEEELQALLAAGKPRVVGISFTTHSRLQLAALIATVRRLLPGVHITLGGHHATSAALDCLKNLELDTVIAGDGEDAFNQLCRYLIDERERELVHAVIPGLLLRSKLSSYSSGYSRGYVKDLDSYPWPDRDAYSAYNYSLIFPAAARVNARKVDYLISSRGCPFACRFCSAHQSHGRLKVRYRNIERVVDEVEYLIQDRGCDGLFIYDDLFTMSQKRVAAFAAEMKRRRLSLPFLCYSRVDTVHYESLKSLRDVGLCCISFGMESGSERMLNYYAKGIDNYKTVAAVKICRELGIIAKGTFIIGAPGETVDDVKQTIKLIDRLRRIQPDFIANIAAGGMFLYPGTGAYEDALRLGVLPGDFSWFKEYPDIEERYGSPIFHDSQTAELLRGSERLLRVNAIKHRIMTDPAGAVRAAGRKIARLVRCSAQPQRVG